MKLKELKKWVNKLPDDQLDSELIYNSDRLSISGPVSGIVKAKSNLYYTGDDDPAQLYTKAQLLENGFEKEEIEEMAIEIKKGQHYITF